MPWNPVRTEKNLNGFLQLASNKNSNLCLPWMECSASRMTGNSQVNGQFSRGLISLQLPVFILFFLSYMYLSFVNGLITLINTRRQKNWRNLVFVVNIMPSWSKMDYLTIFQKSNYINYDDFWGISWVNIVHRHERKTY